MSTKQLSPFAAFASVFMATDRACEDAVHTSWPGSPPLSSKVGSPHGSGHDLDGMGTGSGDTLDEKLRCPSLKISTLRNADRANPCSYDLDVPCGFTYHENKVFMSHRAVLLACVGNVVLHLQLHRPALSFRQDWVPQQLELNYVFLSF